MYRFSTPQVDHRYYEVKARSRILFGNFVTLNESNGLLKLTYKIFYYRGFIERTLSM